MAYLDLSPMLAAMRTRPDEFDMQGSFFRHRPSHHLLNFDGWGNARLHTGCDCATLDISRAQSDEMKAALAAWKVMYWEPRLARIQAEKRAAKINRKFAAHFRVSLWRRLRMLFRDDSRLVNIAGTEAPTPPHELERAPAARERELA
jgi:hypothetical protein